MNVEIYNLWETIWAR